MTTSIHHGKLGPSTLTVTRRADGSIILKSPHPVPPYPRAITDRLDHWAATTPQAVFLAQRDARGQWCRITYAGARALVRNIGQALLDRGLSPERPVAILSGNSLEHALLGLGAMYVGVPYAAISPAYSLISTDFAKLKGILGLLTPGLVFAVDGKAFAKSFAAAVPADTEICVLDNIEAAGRPVTSLAKLWDTPATAAVDAANKAITDETIAKFLFTSGSTGTPKGVVNTHRMMCSNQAMMAAQFPTMHEPAPTLIDWLPWSHTFGGSHNFNLVAYSGGALYIDDGKPLPNAIEETVRNLREIAPTVYFNVPKGFEMLIPYLKAEPALARTFFSRMEFLMYAGAALPAHVADELEAISLEAVGHKVPMYTSIGSTETAPSATAVTEKTLAPFNIGIPNVGVEMKLVPNAGKLEGRFRGPGIMPGYWRQPELTAKAFDDEGYYMIGDAFRFADPEDPEKGLFFDGRVSEDFKLGTGTWVSVGPLRAALVAACAPLVRDAVIAGHNQDDIAALLVLDLDACRAFAAKQGVSLDPAATGEQMAALPAIRERIALMLGALNSAAKGSSFRVERAIVLYETLSIDKGEVTDKGSINQRTALAVRADLVADLYSAAPSPRVLSAVRPA